MKQIDRKTSSSTTAVGSNSSHDAVLDVVRQPIGSAPLNPVAKWTTDPWDTFAERVKGRCRMLLKYWPQLDPADCCQDVLVEVLRLEFARKYDPTKTAFYPYVYGLVRHICARAIRDEYRRLRVLNEVAASCQAVDVNPSNEAEFAELEQALELAKETMRPTEQSAMSRIMDRAGGVRHRGGHRRSTRHVQESRCRCRLRRLLGGHR